jgi:hypothetical protein
MGSCLSNQNTRLHRKCAALLLRHIAREHAAVAERDQRWQGLVLRQANAGGCAALAQTEMHRAAALAIQRTGARIATHAKQLVVGAVCCFTARLLPEHCSM